MPNGRSRKGRGGGGSINSPQRLSAPINLAKFQPRRKVILASETTLDATNPVKILACGSFGGTPGNAIGAAETFVKAFDRARVLHIDVFFDQRGAGATAAIPRATAWLADGPTTEYEPSKVTEIARYAGSGMNQIQPARRFRVRAGPEYICGRFSATLNNASLIVASKDYSGVVRFETTFEVYGPPVDYELPALEMSNHIPDPPMTNRRFRSVV